MDTLDKTLQNPALFAGGTDVFDAKTLNITNRSQLAVMRSAVRPSKSSARKRGGCISCGRFGAAKKDSGRHGANEVGGVPIAFLRRESAAFSAFHAENIRKCNRHGGGAAAGVARRLLPSLRPISSRISSLTSPDLAQIACKSGESVGV